jgi:hypothetical protein
MARKQLPHTPAVLRTGAADCQHPFFAIVVVFIFWPAVIKLREKFIRDIIKRYVNSVMNFIKFI